MSTIIVQANPTDSHPSNPREALRGVPLYRQASGWRLVRSLLRLMALRLWNIWCIWSGAARSFVWHIRIQSPTETPHVDLGPQFEQNPDGSFLYRLDTHARAEGIKSLSAKYPWVDMVHRQIYLMGFDAGVQVCAQNPHIGTDKHSASQS